MKLITDRTQNDVTEKTTKGQYNYTDLNRVQAAVKALAETLTAYGYTTTVETKTDYVEGQTLTLEDMDRYIDNVHKCVRQFCSAGYELPKTLDGIDYIGANNIEKTLVGIEKLLEYMLAVMRYSGTFYSGNEGLRGGYCL